MLANPQEILDATGQVLKMVPEAYSDVAQPAAKQTGSLLARIPHAINAALSGVDIWIAKREYAVDETKKLLAKKLENVDPEKIVPPEPYVAVPAIQAISYSMDSEKLRDMYANLLANSMNSDKKDNVHPGFVEIIKQMSPLDAENLALFKGNGFPIAEYRKTLVKGTYFILQTNVFLGNEFRNDLEEQATSLSSLAHLGLIELSFDDAFDNEEIYQSFSKTQLYLNLKQEIQAPTSGGYVSPRDDRLIKEITVQRGRASPTPLGEAFISVCL
jgi:hypothetical protein